MKAGRKPTPKRDVDLAKQVLRDILLSTEANEAMKTKAAELMFRVHGTLREKKEEKPKEVWLPRAPRKGNQG